MAHTRGRALPPIPESYEDSAYIFLAVTHPENQLKLLNAFPNRKLVVADTIDLYINTTRDELMEVFKRIDGLIINDSEALMLTGEPNAVVAAEKLMEMTPLPAHSTTGCSRRTTTCRACSCSPLEGRSSAPS